MEGGRRGDHLRGDLITTNQLGENKKNIVLGSKCMVYACHSCPIRGAGSGSIGSAYHTLQQPTPATDLTAGDRPPLGDD
jgi:hypothetical protein